MSKLVLVRHGQASFFSDDYDRLSELGERQSRVLGAHWLARGEAFDEVYHGSLKRQIRTAECAGEPFLEAGEPWPDHGMLPGLNEYEADEIMTDLLPILREKDETYERLKSEYDNASDDREKYRTFHRLLEAVMEAWISGEHSPDGLTPWVAFRDRVRDAVKDIVSRGGSGRRVAVFSSGGPIGVTVQSVLSAPDVMAGRLNWRINNCSVTEFTFSGDRIAMDCFNSVAHLTDEDLLTYR